MWATAMSPVADLFNQKVEGVAWRTKPSAYIVATHDHTVNPELERSAAEAHGRHDLRGRQQPRPDAVPSRVVLDAIRKLVELPPGNPGDRVVARALSLRPVLSKRVECNAVCSGTTKYREPAVVELTGNGLERRWRTR